MRNLVCGLIFVSFYFAACSKKSCDYKDDGIIAPIVEQQAVKHYLDSLGIIAALHPRGFYYKVLTPGEGVPPGECSEITLSYKGKLTNETVFAQQSSFVTKLANLIDGWQQGVPLIRKGGDIQLFIPPSLGYGGQSQKDATTGNIVIPSFSILIFYIHLLDVQ
ncbi:FKBP-type peptidyl-prolyl cis-trans isomerase [Flavitalea flava]